MTKANQIDSRRWQKIEQIYHDALELEPSRRAAFLAEACEDLLTPEEFMAKLASLRPR